MEVEQNMRKINYFEDDLGFFLDNDEVKDQFSGKDVAVFGAGDFGGRFLKKISRGRFERKIFH